MLEVIFGEKGAGKSKRIIDTANKAVKDAKGSMIFIDDDNRYMFDLKHEIRFIDASEYGIDGPKMFYGFVCGLVAQDFDLETIYIDGFLKIVKHPIVELEELFKCLQAFAAKFKVNIIISINGDPASSPDFLKPLLV